LEKIDNPVDIIAEQMKVPKEIKDELDNYAFTNLLISIALMIYMIVINLLYLDADITIFSTSIKVLSMLLISIDIAFFEIGYRKDNVRVWVNAFELLVCSILVLSMQYIYLYANELLKNLCMLIPVFCSIYYVGKIIVMQIVATKKYQNNLSDVKDLVKDEEEGYLDDVQENDIAKQVNDIEEKKKQEKQILKQAKKEKKK
jgi:hypothetical protein